MTRARFPRIRTTTVLGGVLMLLLANPGQVAAADQTEFLRKPATVLPNPEYYIDSPSGELSYDRAADLMRMVFPHESTTSPDFYCLVHVLRWGEEIPTIDKSHWFVYRGRGTRTTYDGRWTPDQFAGTRIFGSERLGVMYLHVNVPAVTRSAARTELASAIAGLKKPDGSALALDTLLPNDGQPAPELKSARSNALRAVGAHLIEAAYGNASYQIDVVKKLPAPLQNLQDAIGMVQGARAEQPFVTLPDRVGLYAGGIYGIRHVPSDITISGTLGGVSAIDKNVDLGKQTFDNEGLYYWDVSLGIPVRSTKQLDFQASGGQVFAKEIDSSQLMALLNIFWRPVDTKNAKFLPPSPIVGVALSKKPLTKVLVGLSVGLTRVQVYGGHQWSQIQEAPAPAATADSQGSGSADYQGDWVIGINVPVRQVIEFLKAKK